MDFIQFQAATLGRNRLISGPRELHRAVSRVSTRQPAAVPPASNQLGPHQGKPVRHPPTNSSLQRLQSRAASIPHRGLQTQRIFHLGPGCNSLCARDPLLRCERQTPVALNPRHRQSIGWFIGLPNKRGRKKKKKRKRSKRPMKSVLPPRTSPFLRLAWPGTETASASCHPQGRNPPPPPLLG